MRGDITLTYGQYECLDCRQLVTTTDHFNACPRCGELMETTHGR